MRRSAGPDGRFEVERVHIRHDGHDNRWNDPGVPAVYLTGAKETAVAEWARHLEASPLGPIRRRQRALFELEWSLNETVDLRSKPVALALGITQATPAWVLDKDACRRAGRAVRGIPSLQGFFVPSMAFLDDAEHWNPRGVRRPNRRRTTPVSQSGQLQVRERHPSDRTLDSAAHEGHLGSGASVRVRLNDGPAVWDELDSSVGEVAGGAFARQPAVATEGGIASVTRTDGLPQGTSHALPPPPLGTGFGQAAATAAAASRKLRGAQRSMHPYSAKCGSAAAKIVQERAWSVSAASAGPAS